MTAPAELAPASAFALDPADDSTLDHSFGQLTGDHQDFGTMVPPVPTEADLAAQAAADERRKEKAQARAARAQARAAARAVPPERRSELAHLDIQGLRAYRQELLTEEDRVSYWRRLVQARLDLLRSESPSAAGEGPVNGGQLRKLLGGDQINGVRTTILRIVPGDGAETGVPPLPDLGRLWETTLDELDDAGRLRLADELQSAEDELSHYRKALHERLDAATADLIARYRAEPAACLRALPLD